MRTSNSTGSGDRALPPSPLGIYAVIVADDLTGAADTAARCFGAGLPATIYAKSLGQSLSAGVSAFSSDSRHLSAHRSAQGVEALISTIRAPADALWYKKIDSTLRGNLGSELDAMLRTVASIQASTQASAPAIAACALVCPAFPDQGRGLVNGYLVLDDHDEPGAHLPTKLAEQTTRPQAAIDLAHVRRGHLHLVQQLRQAQSNGAEIIIVDAQTSDDLHTLVAAAQAALPHALYCGSAGLAGALTAYHVQPQGRIGSQLHNAQLADTTLAGVTLAGVEGSVASTLVVVGSGSSAAHQQLAVLQQSARAQVGKYQLIKHQADKAQEQEPPDATGGTLANAQTVVLHLPKPPPHAVLDGAEARAIAETLGVQARAIWSTMWPQRLLVTGGDTAISVLEKLGIAQLNVLHELMPGIPLTRGTDRWGRQVEVILKPGGFGDAQTLANLIQAHVSRG